MSTNEDLGNGEKVYDKIVRIDRQNVYVANSCRVSWQILRQKSEIERLKIDIQRLSEVRWSGSEKKITAKEGYGYYFCPTDSQHRYETAVSLSENIAKSVRDFAPFSDWVMLIKVQTHRNLNIIQAYALTSDKSKQEVEKIYIKVDEAI